MKRRKFFKNAALAAAGIGLVSLQSKARNDKNTTCTRSLFMGTLYLNDDTEKITWKLSFCPAAVRNPVNTSSEDKRIYLELYQDILMTRKIYEATYLIESSKSGGTSITNVTAKQEKVLRNEFTPTSDVNFKLLSFSYDYNDTEGIVKILDKKNETHVILSEYYEYYDDCFLTTACVEFMGKADDCEELTVLRDFRDRVLLQSDEGLDLVKEYYAIAPGLIKAIKSQENQTEVFEGIYREMILPTLERIKKNDARGAITIYKNYTYSLKNKFLS
jgi:hypothetical protein